MHSHLKPATNFEKVSGHMGSEVALTLVGALSGSPLAALLPILSTSLASTRQRHRVEEALMEVDATLKEHSQALLNLSDSQYKLVNEAILSLLHTTSPEKITYLRRAVRNGLSLSDILPQEAVVLSRIIRDISADEAAFLIKNFHFERVQLWPLNAEDDPSKVLAVEPMSQGGLVASGLIALGLLSGAGQIMNDLGRYTFSPIVAKLLVLLREPSPEPSFRSAVAQAGR